MLGGFDGDNSISTYLFRAQFTVEKSDLSSIQQLVGVLECDAAAVVYLNGTKIFEFGEVGTDGYAQTETNSQHSEPLVITNLDALQAGTNTVAVEVHNSSAKDTDMWFHLNLAPHNGKQEQIDEFSVWSWFYERTAEGTHTDPAGDSADEGYDRLSWTKADYDDSRWNVGVGPFGSQSKATPFGNVTPAEIAATLLPDVDRINNPPAYFFRTELYLSAETLRNLEELQASIVFDDAAIVYINGVEVYRSSTAGKLTENTAYSDGTSKAIVDSFSVTDFSNLNLHVGQNTVAIELHQESAGSNDIWLDFEMNTVTGENYAIDDSTVWAYLDGGTTIQSNWTASNYDDGDWKVGVGPFGSDEAVYNVSTGTVLNGCDGEESMSTYYYRTQFTVPKGELNNVKQLVGSLEYDDAAAVYLNGTKIFESGEVESNGYATVATAKQQAASIVLSDLTALKEGVNTIAVEVHNSGATDNDTWFHLNLAPHDGTQEALDELTVWRYLADDTAPAGDPAAEGYDRLVWTEADYNDSEWQLGVGPFGYQIGGAAYSNVTPAAVAGTMLPGLDRKNNYESYFFRTDLYISEEDLENIGSFNGNISFDDGVIVYINGVPVYEGYTNNSATKITQNIQYTDKNGNPTPTEFQVTDIASLNLHAGNNIVALELHQESATSGDIWLDLQLEPSEEKFEQLTNIVMNMGEDETQMNFTWYAPSAAAGDLLLAKYNELVEGEMPSNASTLTAKAVKASDGNYVNNVTATDLKKGTKYAYQVVSGTHKSNIYTFTTPDGDGSFEFAFVADIQIVGEENTQWAASLDKIVTKLDPAFLLSAGDQVNTASSEVEYDGLLDHEQLRSLPFAPVIGNHDNKVQYQEHYESANESSVYGVTSGGGDAYFVYDNVLFMILNSNDKSAAEHKFFMEQAIAETKAAGVDIKWKVVALHHSFYSMISSGEFDRLDLRTTFMPVFEELDIDVVFSGHDHVYARSYMLDGVDHIEENPNYTYDENNIPVSVTDPNGVLYVAGSSAGARCNAMSTTPHACVAVQGMTKRANISEVQVTDTSFTVTTYYVDTMDVVYDQTDVNLMVGADETTMNITWYSDAAGTGTVKLAKQTELVDGAMPEDAETFTTTGNKSNKLNYYSYQTTMTDLEPNTTYAYQLVNTGVTSDIYTFTTDGDGEFSFAFVADPRLGASGSSSADAVVNDTKGWNNTLDIIAENETFSDVSFMLSAGDQVNTANSEYEYAGFLSNDLLTSLPMATVIGNHDTKSAAYNQHFNVPNETNFGVTDAGGDYSFVYNNALFLVINTNNSSVAEHVDFAKSAIAANPTVDWKIVTFHHSIYTVASHATDGSILSLRETIAPLMKKLDIDVVLMGHDHVYCRTYMMDGLLVSENEDYTYGNGEDAIPTAVTDPEGVLYVTANSGSGSKHYSIKNEVFPHSAVQNQEKVPNVSKVTISDNQFTITTYRTNDMTVVDTFTIYRTADKPEPETGYNVTFEADHATVDVYATQEYTTPSKTNVTTALARDSETGEVDTNGNGQVNFKVNVEEGYELVSVAAAPEENYKNLKDSADTGMDGIYRLTKVKGDVTVTIPTKVADSTEPEEPTPTPTPDQGKINTESDTGLVKYLGSYFTGNTNADGGVAEIVKFNEENDCMYLVSGQTLDIVKVNEDGSTTLVKKVDIATLGRTNGFSAGDITSLDVNTDRDLVTIAVQNATYTENGAIVTLNYDGEFVSKYDAGVQPDMVTFSPNGNLILSANEGEPREGYGEGTTDPMGSVTVVDLTTGNATTYTFESLDSSRAALINDGVLLKTDTNPSVDLEPEFIAVSSGSKTAYVTLQENNAVAALDLTSGPWKYVKGLGFKDHSVAGNGLDLDQDNKIDIRNENVYGVCMPDGISVVTINGQDYLITANEGDAREWGDYENISSSKLTLSDGEEAGKKIEYLDTAKTEGLTTGNTYILGGRSFSIWKADTLEQVFDSGDDFETITAAFPEYFNSGHDEAGLDKRSHKKGVEPESVSVLETNGKIYAIVGLERMGGIMVYDISVPANAEYADYLNVRNFAESDLAKAGDLGPEGICTIPAEDSPTGNAMILVANEISGTVTVAQIEKVVTDDDNFGDSSDDDDSSSGGSSSGGSSSGSSSSGTSSKPSTGTSQNEESEFSFVDVKDTAYYAPAVKWAVENGVTSGTSGTTFSPDQACTRAQIVTFLWRAAGSPVSANGLMPFEDISADAYYYNTVLWAVENGITNGTSATTFSPDQICTRSQSATFLWRAQNAPKVETAEMAFTDVFDSAYYYDAVQWAVEAGITSGTSAITFSPDQVCTRAQIVTFIYRCFTAK